MTVLAHAAWWHPTCLGEKKKLNSTLCVWKIVSAESFLGRVSLRAPPLCEAHFSVMTPFVMVVSTNGGRTVRKRTSVVLALRKMKRLPMNPSGVNLPAEPS